MPNAIQRSRAVTLRTHQVLMKLDMQVHSSAVEVYLAIEGDDEYQRGLSKQMAAVSKDGSDNQKMSEIAAPMWLTSPLVLVRLQQVFLAKIGRLLLASAIFLSSCSLSLQGTLYDSLPQDLSG